MNNIFKVIIFILVMFVLVLFILVGVFLKFEYIRQNYTLQEFKNVDTKRASFSLTTIPSRIEHIEPCIKSLLFQNPKTVYLNIPDKLKKTGEEYIIPKWLDKYTTTGQVTLVRTKDVGPATKFMGILGAIIDPEHYIIVVDDDQIYNKYLLSNLVYRADNVGGNKVVSCDLYEGSVAGYAGYILKRKLLNNIIYFIWPNECFLVDDIWISEYFMHEKIEMIQLYNIYIVNFSISESPKNLQDLFKMKSIGNDNLIEGEYRTNVQQINPLYKDRGSKNQDCKNAIHAQK